MKYWRTKSKAEVDFIIEKEGRITPVEIKSELKKTKFTKSYLSFLEKYKPKKGLILSREFVGERENTIFRPIFYIRKALL